MFFLIVFMSQAFRIGVLSSPKEFHVIYTLFFTAYSSSFVIGIVDKALDEILGS